MIEIEGLNTRQRKIADLLWGCSSNEQLQAVLRAMQPRDRRDAQSIIDIMLQEYIWEYLDEDQDSKELTARAIDHARSR